MNPKQLASRMREWASGTKSLSELQEKMGHHDARTAMVSAALTVEGWANELDPPKKKKQVRS